MKSAGWGFYSVEGLDKILGPATVDNFSRRDQFFWDSDDHLYSHQQNGGEAVCVYGDADERGCSSRVAIFDQPAA